MRLRTLGALCATLLLPVAACGSSGGSSDSAGGELGLISSGTLTVCSDIPYPPFEMQQGGDYTGFDIDLVREIADKLKLQVTVKDLGFEGLQSGAALSAGQCDMVASAMTITKKREKNLDFSEPYYDSQQSLLVPADSDIASIEDLSGHKVGVQQGTTGEAFARDNVPGDAEIVAYPSDAELYPAVQSGAVDAVLQDLPVNIQHTQDGAFEIVQQFDTDESYGFAVKEEGSEALLKKVNSALSDLRDNGRYDEIYNKYFSTE
jgi:polar amino acid transport system substrate-binding protein